MITLHPASVANTVNRAPAQVPVAHLKSPVPTHALPVLSSQASGSNKGRSSKLSRIPKPSSKATILRQREDIDIQVSPGYESKGEQAKQDYCKLYNAIHHVLTNFGFRINDTGTGILSTFYGDDTTPHTIHIDNYMTPGSSDTLLSEYKWKIDGCLSLSNAKLDATVPSSPTTAIPKF